MSKSKKEKDWMGNEFIQHYDDNGQKIGYSKEEKDIWGNQYVQHYSQDGKKTGYSEDGKNFWGEERTTHYNEDNEKLGHSEDKKTLFGDNYVSHRNNQNEEVGRSTREKSIFGESYVHNQGSGYDTRTPEPRYIPTGGSSSSSSGGEGGLGKLLGWLLAISCIVYLLYLAVMVVGPHIVLFSPTWLLILGLFKAKEKRPVWLWIGVGAYALATVDTFVGLSSLALYYMLKVHPYLIEMYWAVNSISFAITLVLLHRHYLAKGTGWLTKWGLLSNPLWMTVLLLMASMVAPIWVLAAHFEEGSRWFRSL